MKQRKSLPITIEITVTDSDGNRQTIVRRARMRDRQGLALNPRGARSKLR